MNCSVIAPRWRADDMPEYRAPPLNRRVRVRSLRMKPLTPRDSYGRPVGPEPVWGVEVWAHRRDLAPRQAFEEAVLAETLRSTFTIRWRDGMESDLEVVDGGVVFAAIGPPVERGRRGVASSHLEIVTERRA